MSNILVSTDWLSENLSTPKLVLLDASMSKVVGKKPIEYEAPICIPKSQKCCLETSFCDTNSSSVHAFPTKQQFDQQMHELGIEEDSTVVIYDNQGIYSAPRAWWIFKAMGFPNVFILDGGLPKWLSEGRATVDQHEGNSAKSKSFSGTYDNQSYHAQCVCDANYVLNNLDNESLAVIDARAKERYLGEVPEPRAGVRSGHIPKSVNLPFGSVLDGHCFKNVKDLQNEFSMLTHNKSIELVFSCGSGITACIILVAARLAGFENTVLYDGSWAEWGSNASLPIE